MNLEAGEFSIFPRKLLNGIPANEQVVLAWLWVHKNKRGTCFPSVKKLSIETCLSERTIFRVLKKLEEKKLLTRENRVKNNKKRSNLYKLFLGY